MIIKSKPSFYLSWSLTHLVLISFLSYYHYVLTHQADTGFGDIVSSYVGPFIILLAFIFFYLRTDLVLPWYGYHRNASSAKKNYKLLGRFEFGLYRVISWFFIICWSTVFFLFFGKYSVIFKVYMILICTFLSFYNVDYLFNNYQKYKALLSSNKWKQVHRMF
jgi:hypothetical protein